VKPHVHVVKRKGSDVYYFRARIPLDLQAHFGKSETWVSLQTRDIHQANSKANVQRLKLDNKFNALRGMPIDLTLVELESHPHNPYPSRDVYSKELKEDNLLHLLHYWQSQNKPSARSVEAATFAVQQLMQLTQNKSASKLIKADLVNFKDKRLEKVAPATVEKDLNLLKAIFNTAVNNAKLTTNPSEGVKAPTVKALKKPRIPFNLNDLTNIFSSPVYTERFRPKGGAGEAAYWLPLMALFTGARLTELAQLLVEDLKEEQGIAYLLISNDSESTSIDKRLKTASSHRRIPVHPELIRCGLLDYISDTRLRGQERLFPEIRSASEQATSSYSKWFNGTWLRRRLGIVDNRKVFHSFRHTFKDACRIAELPSEQHDRLTGHSRGSIGDSYGSELYPLKPLATAINKLVYEGLDLSHLYLQNNTAA
jgi:integrase